MDNMMRAGEVFSLAGLVDYRSGGITNKVLIQKEDMKLALLAFDTGTGLSEHTAPGEAVVFALEGEGVIGYEGTDHVIRAGEQFHFAKDGLHSVRAETQPFKMALLLCGLKSGAV